MTNPFASRCRRLPFSLAVLLPLLWMGTAGAAPVKRRAPAPVPVRVVVAYETAIGFRSGGTLEIRDRIAYVDGARLARSEWLASQPELTALLHPSTAPEGEARPQCFGGRYVHQVFRGPKRRAVKHERRGCLDSPQFERLFSALNHLRGAAGTPEN